VIKQNDDKVYIAKDAGFPVIEIIWNDLYDLGAEFMRWELATAIASWKMKIQRSISLMLNRQKY